MYIAIANAIYSSLLQGSRGGFPQACFGLDYNAITSDFTFTRNSFATRVNEFGLIETVTNLGSDLVQNGNFEELGTEQVSNGNFALGSERVINGNFDDGENDWNFGGDWTLVNGTAEILTSTQSYLRSDNDRVPLTINTYILQYEVVTTNGSNMRLAGGSSAFGTVTLDSATVGVKTVYLTSNGTQAYLQINQNSFRGSIDNISLKEVTDWDLDSSWSVSDDKATYDASLNGQEIRQLMSSIAVGKTIKVQFDVLDIEATKDAYFKLDCSGTPENIFPYTKFSEGTYTYYHTITSGFDRVNFTALNSSTGGAFSITNVSVKQVDPNDYWNKDPNWSIANGVATSTGVGRMFQSIPFLESNIGTKVKVSFDITERISGGVQINCYGALSNVITDVGTHTFTGTTTNNTNLYINNAGQGNLVGSIDNVVVQEVLTDDIPRIDFTGSTFDVPVLGDELVINGDFTNGTSNWDLVGPGQETVVDEQLILRNTGRVRQFNNAVDVTKTYIGEITVSGLTNGSLDFYIGSATALTVNSNGVHTFTVDNPANQTVYIYDNGDGWDGYVDNVSVKEVTGYTTTDKGAFLLEPISTNLSNYSGFDSGSGWTRLGSTGAYVSGLAPDGDTSVFELTSVTQGKLQKGISGLSINTQYTLSFYVKQTSPTPSVQSRVLSLTGGSGGSNLIGVNYENQLVNKEWVRITHTFTTNDTLGDYIVYVSNGLTVGKSLQFFGAQVEESSYATSYIPTNGTTVTRAQETCVDATPTINSEEGVLYGELSVPSVDNFVLIALGNSSANNDQNSVTIGFDNGVDFYGRVKSPSGSFTSSNVNAPINTNYKIALRYEQNNCALFVDGVKIASSLTNYLFALPLDNLSFNYNTNNGLPFYGRTKDLKVYCKALTDEQLIELTTI